MSGEYYRPVTDYLQVNGTYSAILDFTSPNQTLYNLQLYLAEQHVKRLLLAYLVDQDDRLILDFLSFHENRKRLQMLPRFILFRL